MWLSLQEEEEKEGERGGGDSGEGGGDPDKEGYPDSSPEGIWESARKESKPFITDQLLSRTQYSWIWLCVQLAVSAAWKVISDSSAAVVSNLQREGGSGYKTSARSVVTWKWNISAVPSELLPGCRYVGNVVRYPDPSLDRTKGLACPPRINYWVRKTSLLSVREPKPRTQATWLEWPGYEATGNHTISTCSHINN